VKLQSYKDLVVWQRSVELVDAAYEIGRRLPASERYGLANQLQRASVSIASNIAEGYARKGTPEYIQFLAMANGSAAEVETQIIIIERQYDYIDASIAMNLVVEVQKMLFVLMKKLKSGSSVAKV